MMAEVERLISFREFDRDSMFGGCGVVCRGWNIPFGIGGEADAAGCLIC